MADWQPGISIRRDGTSYPGNSSYHVTQDPHDQGPNGDENLLSTIAGSDVAAGTWEIVIYELDYRTTNSEEIHLAGPWTFTVAVP